jgi:hypothetical protein
VSKSLQINGYQWVDKASGILPGNVYTVDRPAILRDSSDNYSQWIIEWNGEFATATWLDPAVDRA